MSTTADPGVWQIRLNRLAIEEPTQENFATLEQAILGMVRTCVKKGLSLKVALSITGYGDDPRELYEIPEVCNWARGMVECMPSLWFFLDDESRDRLVGWLCGPVSRTEIESEEFLQRINEKHLECSTAAIAASSGVLETAGAPKSMISSFYFKEMHARAAKRQENHKRWWEIWK